VRQAAAKRRADEFTVARLLESWADIKLRDGSARYRDNAPRMVQRLLGALAGAPAASLTRGDLQAIIDLEIDRAPAQTIYARAAGRAAWNWAMKRGLVATNPFADVAVERRVKSRDRVLSDAELAQAWKAAAAKPYPFGPAVQLLILTLQRLSEVTGMRWSELAPDFSTWTIPAARAKNRRAHVVHLSDPARDILKALHGRRAALHAWIKAHQKETAGDQKKHAGADEPETDFVFTTTGTTAVSGVGRARRSLDPAEPAQSGLAAKSARRAPADTKAPKVAKPRTVTDWRFHDFRRSGASKMAELGIPPHVADRILNHVSGAISGVAAVYQRYDFLAERKRALDVWAAHVLAVAAGKAPGSNVLTMPNALDRARAEAS
jgi:integrase